MVENIVFGTSSHLKILGFLQHTIGSRKRPQDASVEDGSFLCFWMQHLFSINTPVESTILVVYHFAKPKVQDIVLHNILHFLFHGFYTHN